MSLYSPRYFESFTSSVSSVFKNYTIAGTEQEATFQFGFSEGRLQSIINLGGQGKNLRNISGLSQILYYSDELLKCFNKCIFSVDFKFDRV